MEPFSIFTYVTIIFSILALLASNRPYHTGSATLVGFRSDYCVCEKRLARLLLHTPAQSDRLEETFSRDRTNEQDHIWMYPTKYISDHAIHVHAKSTVATK